MKFLVFHNAADDSYMNTVENFRGAFAATETVDIYFKSALSDTATGYDKITVACTNGEEDRAVEQLAAAMVRNAPVITIADDVNSVYACQDITSVTSIVLGANGTIKPIVDNAFSSNDLALTNAMSGSTVLLRSNGGTATITLPSSPVAGWNVDVYVKEDLSSHNYTMAGSFDGVIEQGDASASVTGTTSAVFTGANVEKGDYFRLVYSGVSSKYYIHGIFDTGSAVAIS
jgi:hypothetical protein